MLWDKLEERGKWLFLQGSPLWTGHRAHSLWKLIFPHLITQFQAQDVKQADSRGLLVKSTLPEAPLFHPIYTLRDTGQFFPLTSLTGQWETLAPHLVERRKGRNVSEMVAKRALRLCQAPSGMGWSFLYVPWNEMWIFLASLSLPRPHPALGSWQCQHAHPGITVKIASFFSNNKI